jgi:ferric-dicitrate binding protein FerR (iron transport regulator)
VSAERCSLAWKAAALEDGRLDGADRASFEDHASRCADCRAEKKALAALYAKMRALPAADVSQLEHARRRGALLAKANERFVGPPPRTLRSRWVLLALVVVLASGTSALVSRRGRSVARSPTRELTAPPHYDVTEGAHAVWRTRSDGSVARVDLADGEASFYVASHAAPQQFLVSLPDGEVEATGTRFTIDVALGRTRRVSVADGSLVFRRKDEHEMTLRAGEGWSRTEVAQETPEATANAPANVNPAGIAAGGRPMPASSIVAGLARPSMHASSSSSAPPSGVPPVTRRAGEKFDEAISSFVQGSYGRADVELDEFMKEFPHDARCEDASFLRAVARWRMGDATGARTRAESYLETYPNGLRRSEAQHIVDTR